MIDSIRNKTNYLEKINNLIKNKRLDTAILTIKNISPTLPDDYLSDPTFQIYRGWIYEIMDKFKDKSDEANTKYMDDRLQDIVSSIMSYSYLQDAIAQGYTHKKWQTMEDGKVRPAHRQIDRAVMPINEPFVNSSGSIMYPHDSEASMANTANCRCTLTFIRSDDE